MRMRARGRRDATQQLVREMHETLGKLVENNNTMTEALTVQGRHLRELTAQVAALGERLLASEDAQDDHERRLAALEKKRGGR